MKIRLLLVMLLLMLGPPMFAQQTTGIQNITTGGSDCSTATNCVQLLVSPNSASASITLAGTWTGTNNFEVTADSAPTNWVSLSCVPTGSSTAVTSATANGVWVCAAANVTSIRVRASAGVTGTASVVIRASPAAPSAKLGGGGGGGGSGVTNIATGGPISGGPITATGTITVVGATPGYQIFNQGAIPNSIDASDAFYATSTTNCGSGTAEDVACAINNALRSTNNKNNIIDARGFSGRWTDNVLPCKSNMTHGFTGSGATIYISGYLLCSVPQWGMRQKFSLLGVGIPYSPGVSPYGPGMGECGPNSPPSANWNAGAKTCTVGTATIPQFPDTANAGTFGVKFNVPHYTLVAGSYYPLFIACGMDSTGEGSGFTHDCIGGEIAHMTFDGGGNDTTNDSTLGAGNILFYTENTDVRNEWHDLFLQNVGAANAVSSAMMFADRREAPTAQAGPARFSLTNSNFAAGLSASSTSTYGFIYEGSNVGIDFVQGSCTSLPIAYTTSITTAGVATYAIANNGTGSCAGTPPTCAVTQAGSSLSLSGNLVTNAQNSTQTCAVVLTGGVVTSLTLGTGSGFNPAFIGSGPYSLTNLSMTGNGSAYQDFIVVDGTVNPVGFGLHGETGNGFTLRVGGRNLVAGGTFSGVDGSSGIGGVVSIEKTADDTQQFSSIDYISSSPGTAIVDNPNNCTMSGQISAYGPGFNCNPALLNVNLGAQALNIAFANDVSTGTTSFRAVKIVSTGAIIAANTDTAISGIAIGGAGTSGNVRIAFGGQAQCAFDNSVTEGDFVQISSDGRCHDAGSATTYPTSGSAVMGRVTTTNGSAGTYTVALNIAPPGSTGTVTSVATTAPLGGGTITGSGTLTCGTCVVASSPGVGIAHFAGSTQTATSSTIATADIAANAVTSAKVNGSVCTPDTFTAQTDATTVTWAIASFVCANAALTFTVHSGSRTLNLTGLVTGGSYVLKLIQDATGGESLTGGTGCTWKQVGGGGSTFTLTGTASAIDLLSFIYDGTNCLAVLTKAYS